MPSAKRTPPAKSAGPKTTTRKPNYLAEGKRLSEILRDRKLSKAELARRIKRSYLDVSRWCTGHFFTPTNQAIVCRQLGLPPKALQSPGAAATARQAARNQPLPRAQAEADALAALAAFEQTILAKALHPETWHVLRSIRWLDATLRPTPQMLEGMALVIEKAISPAELADYVATNTELDRTLSEKCPQKGR